MQTLARTIRETRMVRRFAAVIGPRMRAETGLPLRIMRANAVLHNALGILLPELALRLRDPALRLDRPDHSATMPSTS